MVPAGLTFRLGKEADLDVFYMVLSSHTPSEWHHESVLGTFLRIRL